MIRNVYIIDRRISGSYDFLQNLHPDSAYHFLDADRDGVSAILDIVSSYTDLGSLHLISHGAEGVLYLGNAALSAASLPGYEDILAEIGTHLSPGADLLIYGCNVASGPVGQAFITQLAAATGADVAASTNATGGAGAGADGVLEASVGTIEAATLSLADLVGTLGAMPTVTPFKGSSAQAPSLSGTAVVGSGQALKVIVADQAYTTANGLVLDNGAWTLALPKALADGSYDVKVIVSDLPVVPAVADIPGTNAADNALTGEFGKTSRITGGGGDDLITGKSRADMAVYSGNQADYTVSRSDTSVIVKDNRSGSPDGTDTLTGINLLKFADRTVFLEAAANRVYLAGGDQTYQVSSSTVVTGTGDLERFVVTPSVSSTVYVNNGDVVDLARSIDDYQFTASGTKLRINDGTYLTVVNLGGTVTIRTASGSTTAHIDYANGGKVVLGDTQVVGSTDFNPLKAITNASDRSSNAQNQVSDQTGNEIVIDSNNHVPTLTVTATNTFTEDAAGNAVGAVVATFATADEENGAITVTLSDTTNFMLGTGANAGKVLLTQAGLALVNAGTDLPSFTLTPNDGTVNGLAATVDPSVTAANDAPVFTLSSGVTVVEHAAATAAGLVVATYTTPTDEEGHTVTVAFTGTSNSAGYYELGSGADAGKVKLTAAGAAFVNGGGTLPQISLTATDNGTPAASSAAQTATPTTTLVNDAPVLTVTATNTFTEDAAGNAVGAVVATFTTADEENSAVTVTLSDTTNYMLGTGANAGKVLLTQAGLALVNAGTDLPSFTLTPNDGTVNGQAATVDPSVTAVNDVPTLTVTATNTFTEDAAGNAVGAVVATFTTADEENGAVTVTLSDTTNYMLGTGADAGKVLLTQAGLALVNAGTDLPSFTLTPNDGTANGLATTVDPSVTSTSVKVADGQTYTATQGVADIFEISSSKQMTATISGFEPGDVLKIVGTDFLNVDNDPFFDAMASLKITADSQYGEVLINMINLNGGQPGSDLFGDVDSFNAIYGANSIQFFPAVI